MIDSIDRAAGTAQSDPGPDRRRDATGVTLRELLTILFKHKGMIVVSTATAVLATMLWFWIVPNTYEASAKVLIKFGRDLANPRSSMSTAALAVTAGRPDINTEAQLIKSYVLVDQVVTDLRLDNLPPPVPPEALLKRIKYELRKVYSWCRDVLDDVQVRLAFKEKLTDREKVIVAIIEGLDVKPLKESSVVEVRLVTKYKEGAGLLVNTLLQRYRERQLGMQRNPGMAAFFRNQAQEYQQRLVATEMQLAALKDSHELAGLPEETSLTLKQAMEADNAVTQSQVIKAETRARLDEIERALEREPQTTVVQRVDERNTQIDWLEEKKAGLLMDRGRLATKYQADAVQLVDLDEQIANLDRIRTDTGGRVERSQTTGENSTWAALRRQRLEATQLLSAVEAKLTQQRAAAVLYRSRLRELGATESPHNRLTRDIALFDDAYRAAEKRAQDVAVEEALNTTGITSITVLDPAVDPIVAAGMRRIYMVGGALALALILSVGAAFASDALGGAVNTRAQVERLMPWPVLTSVPFDKRAARRISAPVVDPVVSMLANLNAFSDAAGPTIVMFHAPHGRAGTSTVVAAAAEALTSRFGRNVLVVDVSNGVSVRRAREGPEQALASFNDIGRGGIEAIGPRLSRLPAVTLSYDLPSTYVAQLVRELPARVGPVDHVLVDASSSLCRARQLAIARGCDAALLVVDASTTRAAALSQLAADYQRAGVEITGAVLNKRRSYVPEWIYKRL